MEDTHRKCCGSTSFSLLAQYYQASGGDCRLPGCEYMEAMNCHSKTVKSGVVTGLLSNAIKKSCLHLLLSFLNRQLARLRDAGYPQHMLFRC